ncbi:MAG: pyridoxamine 5'-phosphate oxidase [Bacteroidota bacterium]
MPNIADLRQTYEAPPFLESDVPETPLPLFEQWFEAAVDAGVTEPNAMALATVSAEGQPANRIVLLKGLDDGFLFYTNYESNKARDLAARPRAALVFWWEALHRQVRIEGTVEKVSAETSDAYFSSRPRGSRLGAWASDQSRVIPNRDVLTERKHQLDAEHPEDAPIPRPPHWGGYRVRPSRIEFWQGQPSRLHDRLVYRLDGDKWTLERLAP